MTTEALLRRKKVTGPVKNAVITTSHGETFAIAVKHQRPEEAAEDNVVITVAEIAEVATVEEAIEVATTGDRPVENIAGAMIVDHHDVIPENQVDGGPKARAGPASAEISRGAFI